MIGTIRKHSAWLWWLIIAATIVTFCFWGVGPSLSNGGGGGGDYGVIYGKKITAQNFTDARHEVDLFFLFNYGSWPEKNPNVSQQSLLQQTYARLMMIGKAEQMGIHVSDDAAATLANNMLHSEELMRALGTSESSVPLQTFVQQVLQPAGLTADDFENFARHYIAIQQLVQMFGLSGQLATPDEIAAAYRREHQELSAQAVFFSASNYLSQVTVTPAAVAAFYTNDLAVYRLPDRVQISYVAFEVTNFLAQAEKDLPKTNLDEQVDAIYLQYGARAFADAKTPEAAKAEIREQLLHQQALKDARAAANEFATAVFDLQPAVAGNLAAVAKQKNLAVHETAPFDKQYGPQEFTASAEFKKAVFELSADEPLAGPVAGPDAIYVIALDQQFPSEIPPLDKIRARVTQDFQMQQATALAQSAGTNFARTLAGQMAAGKTFAAACVNAGFSPEVLPAFSLDTQDLPELDGRADLNRLKQAAFTTPVGRASGFEPAEDGGFIVFVQSQLPLDEAKMKTDLPQFAEAFRRQRSGEMFNEWLQREMGSWIQTQAPAALRDQLMGAAK